jgi:uridine phosphorylase
MAVMFIVAAGCTGTQTTTPAAPLTTPMVAVPETTPAATITLGDKYLERKYSFASEKEIYTEQFRVTNDPWGIELTVTPTNEDPQYTWFEMTVTNMDNGHKDTFGYGRSYGFEKHQIHPMFSGGPYKVDLKGNRVSVNVNIAKRNP